MEWREGDFVVSDESAQLDVETIHGFLRGSYWATGIPRAVVERSIAGSLCFGLYHAASAPAVPTTGAPGAQVGFARVVTDRATFGYLADVFVLEAWRGRGLSKLIVRCVLAHPQLQGLRRWMLATADAHGLYRQFGFETPRDSSRLMEKLDRDIYTRR